MRHLTLVVHTCFLKGGVLKNSLIGRSDVFSAIHRVQEQTSYTPTLHWRAPPLLCYSRLKFCNLCSSIQFMTAIIVSQYICNGFQIGLSVVPLGESYRLVLKPRRRPPFNWMTKGQFKVMKEVVWGVFPEQQHDGDILSCCFWAFATVLKGKLNYLGHKRLLLESDFDRTSQWGKVSTI